MPRDGGGLRVLAWEEALQSLGYSVEIQGINPQGPSLNDNPSFLTSTKRMIAPMPFSRAIPPLRKADLHVMTVPVVFKSAAQAIQKESLIFDWMDLWSVNARTMGASSPLSIPGGLTQSLVWKHREKNLPRRARFNTVAGFGDLAVIGSHATAGWLPTPTRMYPRTFNAPGRPRRVGFIGNLGYEPNEMSLRKFFRDFGHQLSSKKLEIVVAGFGSERVKGWGVPATVLGSLDELESFYDSIDAVIVPIDHGGGIKVKAVEALARGLIVYGTDHVRSGFSPDFWPLIRNIDELFQSELLDQPSAPTESVNAQIASRFTQDAFTASVEEILKR
ncbi:glycosyltransferase [Cryobacterium sp. CG_9.6]|uniref:glycosyltransferase n=1 Tax=Cryobacterium sp. CG_9.6 TaxID=2760710 RepID=UPI002473279E|nr:glycosyltransferase [Cryobacterium sp. CG_9.6]MDH6235374.1 hypothetical protein [Cryobacterium sp. CG_9.6]